MLSMDESFEDLIETERLSWNEFQEKKINLTGTITCLQNIRSAKKNLDYLMIYLESLQTRIDVIGLTETWGGVKDVTKVTGYEIFESGNYSNQASGVGILVRSSLKARKWEAITSTYADSCFIEVQVKDTGGKPGVNNNKLIIGILYRSPNSSIEDFLNYWENLLNSISREKNEVMIAGDFNIDVSINNSTARKFESACNLAGFRIINKNHTRISNSRNSALDLYITNVQRNTTSIILNSNISDHCTIFNSVDYKTEGDEGLGVKARSRLNLNRAIDEARRTDFTAILNMEDFNSSVETFVHKLTGVLENNRSLVTTGNRYDHPKSDWMTSGILKSLKKQRKLYNKMKEKPKNSSREIT